MTAVQSNVGLVCCPMQVFHKVWGETSAVPGELQWTKSISHHDSRWPRRLIPKKKQILVTVQDQDGDNICLPSRLGMLGWSKVVHSETFPMVFIVNNFSACASWAFHSISAVWQTVNISNKWIFTFFMIAVCNLQYAVSLLSRLSGLSIQKNFQQQDETMSSTP